MSDPLEAICDALSTVWGRALSYVGVILAASFFACGMVYGIDLNPLAILPLVVVASIASGWGIILYPLILIGFAIYISCDVNPFCLILLFLACSLDF